MPMAEWDQMVLNQWTHSMVASSTASMSSQGPWPKDELGLAQGAQYLRQSEAEKSLPWSPPRRLPRSRPGPPRSRWLGTAHRGRKWCTRPVRSTPSEPVQWFVYALVEGLTLMTATDDDNRALVLVGGMWSTSCARLGLWMACLSRPGAGQVNMTGADGLLPALVKETLERGLAAWLERAPGLRQGRADHPGAR